MVTSDPPATFTRAMTSPLSPDCIAFERLVADHHAHACAVAYAVLRDRARSEEITQDALLLAWERRDQIPAHAAAWLCTIARNLARNASRRPQPLPLDRDVADDGDPLHSMLEAEEMRLARAALDELPGDEREAVVLYYRCGESVQAIADALDISEVAARKRLQRGRDHLRERIAGVERRVARTRPSAAFAGAIMTIWLLRNGGATAAAAPSAAAKAGVVVGKAKAVALAVAAVAITGGAVSLSRAVAPSAEAATVAIPAPPAPRPSPAAAPPPATPALPTPTAPAEAPLPPLDPEYANAKYLDFFDQDASGEYTALNVLDWVTEMGHIPIYNDGVDLSVMVDAHDLRRGNVGELFDDLLARLDATRTEVPGLQTTFFTFTPASSCAARFGGDRVDAVFDDQPVQRPYDAIVDRLRVPLYVPGGELGAPLLHVELHGTAGEAFDQLVATAHMGCKVAPGYVITPRH
jgi:RNA polymerase sigma factor (sigma-70 family)